MTDPSQQLGTRAVTVKDRLEGWKEIAAYLNRTVRTVQRWEKEEGLPVDRHLHASLGSVSASVVELDAWLKRRQSSLKEAEDGEGGGFAREAEIAEPAPASTRVKVAAPTTAWWRTGRRVMAACLAALVSILTTASWIDQPPPGARRTATPAHTAYQKGRYAWHKDTRAWFAQSIQYFETAVAVDPRFAQGWAGLATTHATLGLFGMRRPKECFEAARTTAENALSLDASLAEAHAALAIVKLFADRDRTAAERGFRTALALNSGDAFVHQSHAYFLTATGRHDEAIEASRRAQDLEPLSATITSTGGWFYYMARRYDEALAQWRTALELEPGLHGVRSAIATVYRKQGRLEEARDAELEYLQTIGLGEAAAGVNVGDAREALRHLDRLRLRHLEALSGDTYVSPGLFVKAYAELNEPAQLFRWLETAAAEGDLLVPLLAVHPLFDPFRTHPAFQRISRKLSIPVNS